MISTWEQVSARLAAGNTPAAVATEELLREAVKAIAERDASIADLRRSVAANVDVVRRAQNSEQQVIQQSNYARADFQDKLRAAHSEAVALAKDNRKLERALARLRRAAGRRSR